MCRELLGKCGARRATTRENQADPRASRSLPCPPRSGPRCPGTCKPGTDHLGTQPAQHPRTYSTPETSNVQGLVRRANVEKVPALQSVNQIQAQKKRKEWGGDEKAETLGRGRRSRAAAAKESWRDRTLPAKCPPVGHSWAIPRERERKRELTSTEEASCVSNRSSSLSGARTSLFSTPCGGLLTAHHRDRARTHPLRFLGRLDPVQ